MPVVDEPRFVFHPTHLIPRRAGLLLTLERRMLQARLRASIRYTNVLDEQITRDLEGMFQEIDRQNAIKTRLVELSEVQS